MQFDNHEVMPTWLKVPLGNILRPMPVTKVILLMPCRPCTDLHRPVHEPTWTTVS